MLSKLYTNIVQQKTALLVFNLVSNSNKGLYIELSVSSLIACICQIVSSSLIEHRHKSIRLSFVKTGRRSGERPD